MDSRPTPSQALTQLFRDWIPVSKKEYEEVSKETVQTTVWVVALATGLISVAILNQRFLGGLTPGVSRIFISLVLATIVLGVLQRVLQHLLNQLYGRHLLDLHTRLLGFTAQVTTPPEVDLMTDRDKIIGTLQEHFGVDYSFLRTYNVPLPGCQEAYESQYKIWYEGEKNVKAWLAELIAAFSGKPASWGHELLAPKPMSLDPVRKKAVRLKAMAWAVFVIFSLMTASFVGAMIILAWSLVR